MDALTINPGVCENERKAGFPEGGYDHQWIPGWRRLSVSGLRRLMRFIRQQG